MDFPVCDEIFFEEIIKKSLGNSLVYNRKCPLQRGPYSRSDQQQGPDHSIERNAEGAWVRYMQISKSWCHPYMDVAWRGCRAQEEKQQRVNIFIQCNQLRVVDQWTSIIAYTLMNESLGQDDKSERPGQGVQIPTSRPCPLASAQCIIGHSSHQIPCFSS